MRAAPIAHHLTRVLAGMEPAASADGRQVPRPVRRRAPGHGRHATQQLVGGEPQLAAAHLLHPAPPPRRLIPGLAAVLPEPPPLPAQPARRASGQEPTGADDRPGPSALAHPAGPGTASAPTGLTRWEAGRLPHRAHRTSTSGPHRPALFVRPCDPKLADSEPRPAITLFFFVSAAIQRVVSCGIDRWGPRPVLLAG